MAYYPQDEQETTVNYDSTTKMFLIFSSVPKHVRRLLKLEYKMIRNIERDSDGTVISASFLFDAMPNASVFNR